MTFEKVLNENTIKLDEATLGMIFARMDKDPKFDLSQIPAGSITSRKTNKAVTVDDVETMNQQWSLNSQVISKIKNLVTARNGKADLIARATKEVKKARVRTAQ